MARLRRNASRQRLAGAQLRQRKVELEQVLLQDIAGRVILAYKAADKGKERSAIALNQDFKGLPIALQVVQGEGLVFVLGLP